MKKALIVSLLLPVIMSCLAVAGVPTAVLVRNPSIKIHIYPQELLEKDILCDGPTETAFRIADHTLLLWIDMNPTYRFAHRTAYLLISPREARVEKGGWWPVLNGQRILSGKQNPTMVLSPFLLDAYGEAVEVHFHPEELSTTDKLSDGPSGNVFPLKANTLLAWVNLIPKARFVHPTLYILIDAQGEVRVEKGEWWPELNGKKILYANPNRYGVTSPFLLK